MTTPEVHKVELKHAGPLSEISPQFLQGMLNRMAVSYHKYGTIKNNCGPRGKIDALASARQRLDEFERTGNTEFLMDAANFCMIRFTLPKDGEFFEPTDSDRSPGLTTVDGRVVKGTERPLAPVLSQRPRRDGD